MAKTIPGTKNIGEKQMTVKIKYRQRLDLFRIGREAGLKYVTEVIDLLISRYDRMQGEKKKGEK